MKLERTMEIDTLEQMCELMCGGIEEDYEDEYEYNRSRIAEKGIECANSER